MPEEIHPDSPQYILNYQLLSGNSRTLHGVSLRDLTQFEEAFQVPGTLWLYDDPSKPGRRIAVRLNEVAEYEYKPDVSPYTHRG
jgi:hypothetical protein